MLYQQRTENQIFGAVAGLVVVLVTLGYVSNRGDDLQGVALCALSIFAWACNIPNVLSS